MPEPIEALGAAAEHLFRGPVAAVVVRQEDGEYREDEDSPRAAAVLGKRAHDVVPSGAMPIDGPSELGYHCPVCEYPTVVDGEYDERLTWSEYRAMLWCYECEKDYPSALCLPGGPGRATETFLDSVEHIITVRLASVLDRAAAWAQELADAEKVLASLTGEEDDDQIGAPLAHRLASAYGRGIGAGYTAGQRAATAPLTPEVLAAVLRPRADDATDELEHAKQVRARLAAAASWLV